MGFSIFISLVVTAILSWGIAKRIVGLDSPSGYIACVSGVSAVVIFQFVLMACASDIGAIYGLLVFGSVILVRASIGRCPENREAITSKPFKLSPVADAVYRDPDHVDDPLERWRDCSQTSPSLIADIEFDYRDAKGQDSHRRVHVDAVDDFYFQGFCLKAADIRTFVIGRVKGKVLDCETGELMSAKSWAKAARQHPDNDPEKIEIGRDQYWDDDPPPDVSEHAEIEICFTGFVKADKLRLEGMAELADMKVRQSVTKGLTHLCTGPNAGPAKISQAIDMGAELIDQSEFFALVEKS